MKPGVFLDLFRALLFLVGCGFSPGHLPVSILSLNVSSPQDLWTCPLRTQQVRFGGRGYSGSRWASWLQLHTQEGLEAAG
jgi:hypothetical protein